MKKGINYWSFSKGKPLTQAMSLAKEAGFTGIEFCIDESGELSISCGEDEIHEVRHELDRIGLEVASICSWLGWVYPLTSDDKEMRLRAQSILHKMVDIAVGLGTDTILCVPGYVGCDFVANSEIIPYEVAIERAREGIGQVLPYAASRGVTLAIENVWNKMLLSPLEMRAFVDSFNSPFVGTYFDVANCILTGYPDQWIRILGPRIKRIHFKDYRRDPGGFRGFVELLAGDVDFRAVMRALRDVGFNNYCTAEIMPTYSTYTDAVIYNTSLSMDYIFEKRKEEG
ncbi:MAG TPA: sugar phosphate isomerase/epimerase family protein [Spirochaetales bacterium]|nr:sugar phosphate isomerase/epimerase family protein [Spirochaetales bacterium]